MTPLFNSAVKVIVPFLSTNQLSSSSKPECQPAPTSSHARPLSQALLEASIAGRFLLHSYMRCQRTARERTCEGAVQTASQRCFSHDTDASSHKTSTQHTRFFSPGFLPSWRQQRYPGNRLPLPAQVAPVLRGEGSREEKSPRWHHTDLDGSTWWSICTNVLGRWIVSFCSFSCLLSIRSPSRLHLFIPLPIT